MTDPYEVLAQMRPPGWDRLTPDQLRERADTVLFIRRRADDARVQGRLGIATELELLAQALVGGEHEGCYGRHSVPPPAGWESCHGG